ncbi:MAG: hypothetical protein AB2421_14195 [Thermotaleaceae bacterium]
MNRKENILILISVVLVIALLGKSFFLDEVRNIRGDELKFKQFVDKAVEEKMQGFMTKKGLIRYRVVAIEKLSDEGTSLIEYLNEEGTEYVEGSIEGQYQAKVRAYFLHVIPYKDIRVRSRE